jgi:hypothetical protein
MLAYFAADDIMALIASPLLFYPFIGILGAFSLIYSMGLNTVVIPVVRQATNLILKGIHIPIQI